jgi:hypothetical protein
MGLLTEAAKNTPVIGQAIGFSNTAVKVYNATSPATAVCAAVEGIFVDCMPPQVKYPVKCAILAAQMGLAVASATNPVTGPLTLSLAIGQATSILTEKIVV